jgi:hypothetical protein
MHDSVLPAMLFEEFPKISRLSRECVITEKIDGTNAQVIITDAGELYTGSRTRLITPEDDNAGFARWVQANRDEVLKLGPGRHFGEWWGQGIQRGYGLKEKRFSLFNTTRWTDVVRPTCCHVVPELFRGTFSTEVAQFVLNKLATDGSSASPGFMKPEGIVIFHTAAGICFKKTIEKDDQPKSMQKG